MVVVLDRPGVRHPLAAGDIQVGLLNLMAGPARRSCERQVVNLLKQTSGATRVHLRVFSLPATPSAGDGATAPDDASSDVTALLGTRLDGLFVSGAEPQAADLAEEAFWPVLTQVVDWAKTNTQTTIWSCLAAHAAVRHLDGIERRRLPEKCAGAFVVEPTGDHPLLHNVATPARVFHSRWNDVSDRDLTAAGYTILTRGSIGVDSFVKTNGSRFVFLQGHPEYDAGAIGREYRRDIGRFLAGASPDYPTLPAGYFDDTTAEALRRFEDAARRHRDPELIRHCPASHDLKARTAPTPFGATLFRNWLALSQAAAHEYAVA